MQPLLNDDMTTFNTRDFKNILISSLNRICYSFRIFTFFNAEVLLNAHFILVEDPIDTFSHKIPLISSLSPTEND